MSFTKETEEDVEVFNPSTFNWAIPFSESCADPGCWPGSGVEMPCDGPFVVGSLEASLKEPASLDTSVAEGILVAEGIDSGSLCPNIEA